MKYLFATVMVCVLPGVETAHAQSMKPGMWEVSRTSTDPADAARVSAMQERMAKMTPEERQRMADMPMINMPGSKPGQIVTRICITPEEAAQFKGVQNSSPGCTHAPPVKSGNSVHFKTTCPSITSESDVTFHGDTSYEAKVTLTMEGKPRTQMVEGKWLAAKCDSSAM
jgi:hypothetical protein